MIITSLLDTDLYKFTMMQAVLHQFPSAWVEYKFFCRAPEVKLGYLYSELTQEINNLCQLNFTEDELNWLRELRFIKSDFVDFLSLFHLNAKYIDIGVSASGQLEVTIRGPWLHTILFEIPVLAIINEIHFRRQYPSPNYQLGFEKLQAKVNQIATQEFIDLKLADYGTRRRFSQKWHEDVLSFLIEQFGHTQQLAGTSNVAFAKKLNLTPLGTMAHEYLQAAQALGPRLRDSQVFAFDSWAREYRGDLGIALSDICGLDAFLRDFDMYFCKLFDGARHDSGDPFLWGEKILQHYRQHRVDPISKTLVFSDGLTMPLIVDLYRKFRGRCMLAFGIGTNLTIDLGYKPLQIVIKMTRCYGQPVTK
ncbi:MAG: nicotinate phosphoribosyltransferase, partial [Gammaproteobacteria bacterium]|nr:nicotinate phosphoribosyltransferase [Gammaproteobacteria bacterium]